MGIKEALKIMGYPIAGGVIGGTVKVFLSNYGPLKNTGEIVTGLLATAVTVSLLLTCWFWRNARTQKGARAKATDAAASLKNVSSGGSSPGPGLEWRWWDGTYMSERFHLFL